MAWNKDLATKRIQKSIDSFPQVDAAQFEDYLRSMPQAQKSEAKLLSPLDRLGHNKAIVVDGVHVYVNLVNYDERILKDGRETEAAHADMLEFLHLHYRACDKVIENRKAQRVDFHGPRMHAVVLEPHGKENMKERVIEAMELAQEMQLLSDLASKEIGSGRVARFRIGIDVGPSVAIDSGTSDEPEPLFLGGSANYAAKLAEGTEAGIFISNNARRVLGLSDVDEKRSIITKDFVNSLIDKSVSKSALIKESSQLMAEWKEDIKKAAASIGFKFKYYCPPLKNLKFQDLYPSSSVRMSLVSIYADIDGYTRYIDDAIKTGQIAEAVKTLHVIREEFQRVLMDDYQGRKVRFIGDCMHGLIAEGTESGINEVATVRAAAECVAALRSSFKLCQQLVPHASSLGLAIGFELGETPISRVGIRGERSIRLATSVATITSEKLQSKCDGNETAIGEAAYAVATPSLKYAFESDKIARDFDYNTAAVVLAIKSQNHSSIVATSTQLRAHAS